MAKADQAPPRLHYWLVPRQRGNGFAVDTGRRLYSCEQVVLCHEQNLGSPVKADLLRPTGIVEHWLGYGSERWSNYAAYIEGAAPISAVPFDAAPELAGADEHVRAVFEADEQRQARETREMFFLVEQTFELDGLYYGTLDHACRAFEAKTATQEESK